MEPARLVYVLRYYPALTETFIEREIACLARRGRVAGVLACGPEPGQPARAEAAPGVAVRYAGRNISEWWRLGLPSAASGSLGMPRALVRIVRAARRDLAAAGRRSDRRRIAHAAACAAAWVQHLPPGAHLHAHFANDPALAARYLARGAGLPFSFTGHARDLTSDRLLLDEALAEAAFAVGISRENCDALKAASAPAGAGAAPVHLVHCGLPAESFAPASARSAGEAASAESGASAHSETVALRIVSVGRLVEKKGHDTLLEAVAALPHAVVAELAVVGDGPLAKPLHERAGRIAPGRIRFVGAVDPPAVRRLLDAADLFVLASRPASDGDRDGIPVALLEAMAAGLPVVSTTMPGIVEAVPDGAGRLVPPADPRALAEAIASIARLTGVERRAIGERARAAAAASFDLERCASALLACVDGPAGARSTGPLRAAARGGRAPDP